MGRRAGGRARCDGAAGIAAGYGALGQEVQGPSSRIGRRQLLTAGAAALLAGCARDGSAPHAPGAAPPGSAAPPVTGLSTPTGPASPRAGQGGAARPAPAPASVIRSRPPVPVLCFHQVRDWRSGDGASARTYITPPRRLAEQLAALAEAGYTTITPDQLMSYLEYGTPLPPRPVMLAFDDGAEGQYTNALPLLLRHHFVATFFVMTVVLDKPTWLSRAQVRELPSRGMTIGAHTYDHPPVTGYTGTDWQTQLVRPARQLTHLTGQPVRYFAYPYGVWNRAALPHLHAAGYRAAFQLADRQDAREPLLTIRRIIASSGWDGTALVRAIDNSF